MPFIVRFKNVKTGAYKDVLYKLGDVLPKVGDRIISPFNEEKWIAVVNIVGQVSGSPYEIDLKE
jgi:hypothetical protein